MRLTRIFALAVGIAVAAASPIPGGDDDKGDRPRYGPYTPPVTVTVTETKTSTKYEVAPPVTHTVTSYIGELYDQSYGHGYELGDVVAPDATITETKTFSVAYSKHGEEKTSTTELTNEWTIHKYSSTTTVWVTEARTNIIWVEPTPVAEPPSSVATHKDSEVNHRTPTPSPSSVPISKPSHIHHAIPTHHPPPAHASSAFSTKSSPTSKRISSKPASSQSTIAQPSTSGAKSSPSHAPWPGTLISTPDGTCGPQPHAHLAFSCAGNTLGTCCSAYNHCGNSTAHCGPGCQPAFGTCDSGTDVEGEGRVVRIG